MEKEYDVIVAGAGPGGALTALALQKEGVNIALVDKARFPRDKVCGDALSGKVVSILRNIDRGLADKLSVFPEKIGSWGVRFVAPNTQSLDIPFKSEYSTGEDAPGYISKRIDFDNFLVEEVKKHNHIDFLEEWEIGSVETDNTGVRVGSKQNGSTLHAKLLIADCGAHSTIA
ncbi:MAG: FAD-dependent monooxygenase, partial [Bacteroidetes bacterium]|nr:FAD-dependent monooxygenase [Bacteroidota bacterium]